MKKSPNNSNNFQQSSTYSTNSVHTTHQPTELESSGIASMLSPRNIMKFFSKNVEEMVSPRGGMFGGEPREGESRFFSKFRVGDIEKEFEAYLGNVSGEMKKYKNNCHKKLNRESQNNPKQRQRQQLEQQIKISKIPTQYFDNWQHQPLPDLDQTILNPISLQPQPKKTQCKKSTKLRTLLHIEQHYKDRKKSKSKRRPLQQKQMQLETYLDQIQVIIYNKTCKYPDRYLHYLINLNDSDIQVVTLVEKVQLVRKGLANSNQHIRETYERIRKMELKKKKIGEILEYMNAMRQLYQFKKQSQNYKTKNKITAPVVNNQQKYQKKSSNELMKFIHQHPKIQHLHRLKSIKQTLLNIDMLGKTIRAQRLEYICDQLRKNLSNCVNNTYSRDSWLKSQLPKNYLMINRMKPEIQGLALQENGDEKDMNNSYLNISVLDQSYCVGSTATSSKKQVNTFGIGMNSPETKLLIKEWQSYCKEYCLKQTKLVQEDEQISQIFQRIILKYVLTFNRDLQDYIMYLYTQKSLNPKIFSTTKQLFHYIQPKFFNKISSVFFLALSTTYTFSTIFKILPTTCSKLLKTVQQKLLQFIGLRNLSDFHMVENRIIQYDDVVEIISSLDYWFQYSTYIAERQMNFDDDGEGIEEKMLIFQQNLHKKKNAIVQEYMANLHKFALINDLKQVIQKQDFTCISIPVSSFSILDSIINWGQQQSNQQPQNLKNNEIEQSFNYGTSILTQTHTISKRVISFSIFKVIDKKLIIEGKEYKVCGSLILLAAYLQVYLKAKVQFTELSFNIQERTCQLIGFYIWYCKKIIFTASHNNESSHHSPKISSPKHTPAVLPSKKTIPNLCMLINLCDLLAKFMDILNITSKPKKVDKVLNDFKIIKQDSAKELSILPFLEIQRQISCLYQSRLKTRKEIPTKQSTKIIQIFQQARRDLSQFCDITTVKKVLENTVKIVSKNYFGYLSNMEARGKAQLKWFLPKFKEIIGDLFPDDMNNLEKQIRF